MPHHPSSGLYTLIEMASNKQKEAASIAKSSSFAEHWDTVADRVEARWDNVCDWFADRGEAPKWIADHFLRRLTVEAPVVICFCFLCVVIHILASTVMPGLNHFLAVQDTFQLLSVMQYPRLLTHILAHDGLAHIKGNMTHLLMVGPSCEHVYGSGAMLYIFGLVAVASAAAHIVVGGTHTHQLGASGIVFSTILLNSLVAAEVGKIPVSFVLTAGLWVTDELYKFFFGTDGVSHHAHLTGAIVGTAAGYYLHGDKAKTELKRQEQQAMSQPPAARPWWMKTKVVLDGKRIGTCSKAKAT